MITKEEREELAKLVAKADGEWRIWAIGDLVIANDIGDWAGEFTDEVYTRLAVAAVNAAPKLLAALDAETARADALERRVADVEEDALCDAWEAQAWQPLATAPKDGTWIVGLRRPPVGREREPFEMPAVLVQWRDFPGRWSDGIEGHSWDDELVGWRALPKSTVVSRSVAKRLKETGRPAAPTWRTMETAPLDGTPVLVHTGLRNGIPHIEVMRFHGFLAIPSALPRLADWRWMPIPEGGL
jgi:hypothetical protein